MTNGRANETVTVRGRRVMWEALRAEADRQNRSLSNMAAQAIEDWCAARSLIKREERRDEVAGS